MWKQCLKKALDEMKALRAQRAAERQQARDEAENLLGLEDAQLDAIHEGLQPRRTLGGRLSSVGLVPPLSGTTLRGGHSGGGTQGGTQWGTQGGTQGGTQ